MSEGCLGGGSGPGSCICAGSEGAGVKEGVKLSPPIPQGPANLPWVPPCARRQGIISAT